MTLTKPCAFDHALEIARCSAGIDAIKASAAPLRWVVNSHWHLDHIGGNAMLRAAFPQARPMASEAIVGARSGFLAGYRAQGMAERDKLPDGDARRAAWQRELAIIDDRAAQTPDEPVRASADRTLAGRRMHIGLERDAVTAGDVWLLDVEARVLAARDLVTLPVPLFDTACPARWAAALDHLAAQRFDWLMPGHGPALPRAGFETYRAAFGALLQCAASKQPQAECSLAWLDALGEWIPSPERKLGAAYLDYYLEQHLRAPPAQAGRYCPAA